MTAVELYTFPATGAEVRTIIIDGEPWFVAADVTAILGYTNGRDAVAALPERMRNTVAIRDGIPGNPNRNVLSEFGVYRLVMRSTLPAAEAFQDWLAEEVIPSIRRTGSYGAPAVAELSRRDLAQMVIEEADRADAAERALAVAGPAAESWNTLASANGDYSVGDAAKVLARGGVETGQRRLFATLDGLGWVYRSRADGSWRAMQLVVDRGWLSELPQSHYHPQTGDLVLDPPQVRVSVAGLAELRRRLAPKLPEVIR